MFFMYDKYFCSFINWESQINTVKKFFCGSPKKLFTHFFSFLENSLEHWASTKNVPTNRECFYLRSPFSFLHNTQSSIIVLIVEISHLLVNIPHLSVLKSLEPAQLLWIKEAHGRDSDIQFMKGIFIYVLKSKKEQYMNGRFIQNLKRH